MRVTRASRLFRWFGIALIGLLCLACAQFVQGTPTQTPDYPALETRVARVLGATLTAKAPTPTWTPEPTPVPGTDGLTPTPPAPTPTSTPPLTPSPEPTRQPTSYCTTPRPKVSRSSLALPSHRT